MNERLYRILKWISIDPNRRYPECQNFKEYWDLLEELADKGYVDPRSVRRIPVDRVPYGYIIQCDKAKLTEAGEEYIKNYESQASLETLL